MELDKEVHLILTEWKPIPRVYPMRTTVRIGRRRLTGRLSLLDPRTKFLSFGDDKHFPPSWKQEGNGFLAMDFKSFYSEIQDTTP
jgi:hypothetical protein